MNCSLTVYYDMEVSCWFAVAPRTTRIVKYDNAVSSSAFVCFFYRVGVGNLQRNNLVEFCV